MKEIKISLREREKKRGKKEEKGTIEIGMRGEDARKRSRVKHGGLLHM